MGGQGGVSDDEELALYRHAHRCGGMKTYIRYDCVQRYLRMNATLESSLLWAITFGGSRRMCLAYAQSNR